MLTPFLIAFHDNSGPSSRREWWAKAISDKLGACQLVALDSQAALAAEYALVWKPPHGRLKQLSQLKLIVSLGQGVDHLLSDPELPKTVPIIRLVDSNMSHALSHWVILSLLDFLRDGPAYRDAAQRREFAPLPQRETENMPVAIYGMGAIGRVIAERLNGLGFDVHGWSRGERDFGPAIYAHHGKAGFEHVLANCAVHICVLPLTPETQNLFDREAFAQMPEGAYFINGGRGRQVVEDDLLAAIQVGHLAGASLDVFVTEPLPASHPFWDEPRVSIWPHVAAQTNPRTSAEQVARAIKNVRGGHALANQIDLHRGY